MHSYYISTLPLVSSIPIFVVQFKLETEKDVSNEPFSVLIP